MNSRLFFFLSFLLFYIIITPIGIFLRLLNLIKIKKDNDASVESYWIKKKQKKNTFHDMKKQK